jgi:single-strand DNA-binding protein
VRVVGRLKQDRWEDPEGKTRSKVHIVAEHVEFKPKFKTEDAASAEEKEESGESDESEEAVDFPEEATKAAS